MERLNPASRHDALLYPPPAGAILGHELITPFKPSDHPTISTSPLRHPIPRSETLAAASESQIQICPPPEQDSQDEEIPPTISSEAILAKIRARYDFHLQCMAHTRKQLRQSPEPPEHIADEAAKVETTPACITYRTPFGEFSFPGLVERTRKYAAFALHYTYQVNLADIDDGLQAGYLRLWQRLEKQPDLLTDKALAWIGKGIIYTALHATRGDWQFRRHTTRDRDQALEVVPRARKLEFKAHSRESRQSDVRTDLHGAIKQVAERILTHETGKRGDHDLWALYGLTMLQTSASELSRLFRVREQSMQAAYNRVRGWLQEALPNYVPQGETTPMRKRGREALPRQEVTAIRKANGEVSDAVYEVVKSLIQVTNADTRQADELALDGIRWGIPSQRQAQEHGLPTWRMQRAYQRVHLMIGAQRDPNVRVRRPERRVKSVFTLTAATATAVERLAHDLLQQSRSYEKLVALHAHISNLAISTTAKHFNIPTSTLRYYAQQIGQQLGTPTKPAREG